MTDLAELFARDPRQYSKDGADLRAIIARMREAQAQFELGVKVPVAERKTKKPTKADLLVDLGLIDGDDLKKLGLG